MRKTTSLWMSLFSGFGRASRRNRRAARSRTARGLSCEPLDAASCSRFSTGTPAAARGPLGGTGTWANNSGARWYNPNTGNDVVWNNANGDTAMFSGTAGTVSLSGQVSAGPSPSIAFPASFKPPRSRCRPAARKSRVAIYRKTFFLRRGALPVSHSSPLRAKHAAGRWHAVLNSRQRSGLVPSQPSCPLRRCGCAVQRAPPIMPISSEIRVEKNSLDGGFRRGRTSDIVTGLFPHEVPPRDYCMDIQVPIAFVFYVPHRVNSRPTSPPQTLCWIGVPSSTQPESPLGKTRFHLRKD